MDRVQPRRNPWRSRMPESWPSAETHWIASAMLDGSGETRVVQSCSSGTENAPSHAAVIIWLENLDVAREAIVGSDPRRWANSICAW